MHYLSNKKESYLFSPCTKVSTSPCHPAGCSKAAVPLIITHFPHHVSEPFFLKDVRMEVGGTTRCLRKKFITLDIFKFVSKVNSSHL